MSFYGADRDDAHVSQVVLDHFWLQCMQVGLKAAYDGVAEFSESEFADDLAKTDVPVLVVHCGTTNRPAGGHRATHRVDAERRDTEDLPRWFARPDR